MWKCWLWEGMEHQSLHIIEKRKETKEQFRIKDDNFHALSIIDKTLSEPVREGLRSQETEQKIQSDSCRMCWGTDIMCRTSEQLFHSAGNEVYCGSPPNTILYK